MSAILLIIVPLLLAFVTTIFKKQKQPLLLVAALFNAVLIFFVTKEVVVIGGFEPPYGISLLVDGYAYFGAALINVLFALFILLNSQKVKEKAVVLLVLLAGLNGLLLTNDLFNLFVFIEITAIATYIMTTEDRLYKTTFHYLVIGVVGSGLYLLGLMSLYNMLGTLNLTDLFTLVGNGTVDASLLTVPFLLMIVGLGVEVKLFPFSGWVKSILENADELVAPLIGSLLAGTFLIVFGRLVTELFILSETIQTLLVVLALVTLVVGEAMAFKSKSVREILLFSSIAQAGLVTLLFTFGLTYVGILAIASNVLSKFIMYRAGGLLPYEVESIKGVFVKNKCIGIPFTVATLSLVGFPLFLGFYVKMHALFQLINQAEYLVPAVILITAVVEGAYFITMLVKLWNPSEEGKKSSLDDLSDVVVSVPVLHRLILSFVAALIIFFGLVPSAIKPYAMETNTLNNAYEVMEINTLGGTK